MLLIQSHQGRGYRLWPRIVRRKPTQRLTGPYLTRGIGLNPYGLVNEAKILGREASTKLALLQRDAVGPRAPTRLHYRAIRDR